MKQNYAILIKQTKSKLLFALFVLLSCNPKPNSKKNFNIVINENNMDSIKLKKTEEEWKAILTPEEYRVLREKGTERPFTGEYENHWDSGTYVCKACNTELFTSSTKFDAGCGWPSFYKSIDSTKILEKKDLSHGMVRVEVLCANCGGHLGHVFEERNGTPTNLRYCINSVSLGFKKKE